MFSATLIVLVLWGQTPHPSPDPAALVEKLGTASNAEREATKSLESLGSKALPALRSALKSKDPEVRSRAGALIDRIEGKLALKGTYVRVDLKNATLQEIVDSLADQAGYVIWLMRTPPGSESRRFTLHEREPVPIWKAIEKICQAGRLTCNYQDQIRSEPGLVLYDQQGGLIKPTCSHGPFQFSLISLSYDSQLSYDLPALPSGPVPGGGDALKRRTRKEMGSNRESSRVRTRGTSGALRGESEPP